MKKTWFILLGYCVGLGGLVLITYRTILALSTPGKMVLVSVNRFGEQYLDVVALVFLWVVCLVGMLCLVSLEREFNRKEHASLKRTSQSVVSAPVSSMDGLGSLYQPGLSTQIHAASEDFFLPDTVYRFRTDVPNQFSVSIVVSPEDLLKE